jgi:hypothetical protein
MMEICWYCDWPIDVDESIEGHVEIHTECLIECETGGSWAIREARWQAEQDRHRRQIVRIDRLLTEQRNAILRSA